MLVMVSSMLLSVEYLHYIICIYLLPLYVVSSISMPCEFILYPTALIMSGLWCVGLLCFGRMLVGMMVGFFM